MTNNNKRKSSFVTALGVAALFVSTSGCVIATPAAPLEGGANQANSTAPTLKGAHGNGRKLTVRPNLEMSARYRLRNAAPLTRSDVVHVLVQLFIFDGTNELPVVSEQGGQIETDIPAAYLDDPITFSNLQDNTTYRVRATVYKATGTNLVDVISNSLHSYLDIHITNQDVINVGAIPVKLLNPGNADSSGIQIVNGQLGSAGTVSISSPASHFQRMAGSNRGYADGTLLSAKFSTPVGIAQDGNGNVFISDTGNNLIRKISSSGSVSTFAGNGEYGLADGANVSAKFASPRGLAVDNNGFLYVADTGNNCIRKVAPNGDVVTVAGTGVNGFQDGEAAVAMFDFPESVAIDTVGNLIVADSGGNRIRKVAANVVSTVAGNGSWGYVDGLVASAEFGYPCGIAIDGSGNILVADQDNSAIRRIEPGGNVSTIFRDAELPELSYPRAIMIGPSDIYFSDQIGVWKLTPTGTKLEVGRIRGAEEMIINSDGHLMFPDAEISQVLLAN